MKTLKHIGGLLFLVVFLLLPHRSIAAGIDPANPSPDILLDQWSFHATNWVSDSGHAPVAFTNIANLTNILWIDMGDTNPAYLFYKVAETDGSTNIVCSNGTISLWFNPDWSSFGPGTGPGDWANLISLGEYGTNGSSWWAWYLDPNGTTVYFSAQTNGSDASNYLTAPVSFVAGNWYNLVLTYSPTNSAFYTNGVLVTNGTGVDFWPGPDVTFFAMGSDSNGFHQSESLFSYVQTYNYPLDPRSIAGNFGMMSLFFGIMPSGSPDLFTNSPPNPPLISAPLWFTGPGIVQYVMSVSCTNSNTVAMVNVKAVYATNGTTSFSFTVAGGVSGEPYDVYGTTVLAGKSVTNAQWAWLGQCYSCGVYEITTTNVVTACFMLGSSQQGSSGDGLTIAFQALVSKTDPSTSTTDGLPDAWIALNGLTGNPNLATQDPDKDGLNNGQEYLYGTKPLVAEGTTIWVGNPNGFSGIP